MRAPFIRAVGAVVAAGASALSGVAMAGGAQAASPGASAQVPAGFQPAAASFTSPTWGVVLGGARCHAVGSCRARLLVTSDGGSRWRPMTTPRAWLAGPNPQVSAVLFANRSDGYLFDRSVSRRLLVTHDGGARWRLISLPGVISGMAASAGRAYAVVGNGSLVSSRVRGNTWTKVRGVTGSNLAVYRRSVWLGGGTHLWATANGSVWHKYRFRCPGSSGLIGIAPASTSHVAFLCGAFLGTFHTSKRVLASANGGRTEHVAGRPAPLAGDPTGFAGPAGQPAVFTIAVVTPGQSYLARSANGGRSWNRFNVPHTEGGVNLGSLAFASGTVGWVVVGGPGQIGGHGLLRTTNSGRTWHRVTF